MVDTLAVGVGTPLTLGHLSSLWNSRHGEPTDAGGLGTDKCVLYARVMELVDVTDSKSVAREGVWVRVPPWAPVASVIYRYRNAE